MKIHILILTIILLAICGNACINEQEKEIKKQSFFTIDFPGILKNRHEGLLSGIAQDVNYIKLQTNSNCFIGRIEDAKFTKDYIFIHHNGNKLLAQFDKKGNFIRNIGKLGRGPGEYSLIREFSIDPENRLIYIQPNYTKVMMVFSFDGEYHETLTNINAEGFLCWAHDTLFIQFHEPILGNEKYVFIEKDSDGDTLQVVKNFYYWDKSKRSYYMTYYWGRNVFYRYDNKLHFKGWYNDTIYTIDSLNNIIPAFFIDLKQYKLPDELRPERNSSHKVPKKYYWVGVRECSNYVFIQYASYSLKIADKEPGGYMYFDKRLKKGYTLNHNNEMKGFVNDMDGVPDFFPAFTNDSLAFQFINAVDFIKYFNSEDFSESNPKLIKKRAVLIKQMHDISENDNPILMIVKLK